MRSVLPGGPWDSTWSFRMAEELIISISGLRGIVGDNLRASTAADYGSAFGSYLKGALAGGEQSLSVCIGRDSRPSGQMLTSAVAAGLSSAGVDVIDLGIVTTPSVGIMVRHSGCAGGVIVTASHNPVRYNGIKLLLGNGVAPPHDAFQRIRQIFFGKRFEFADSVSCGKVTSDDSANANHIERVLAIVDSQAVAANEFAVVLDSVNGAGGRVTAKLLEKLGCTVFPMNNEPTGLFAHPPEPVAENLKDLCEAVKSRKVDIGFAQDPDGDRLAIVDEHGTYIGEEYTLALAAMHAFGAEGGTAATNLSTSRMIDDIAGRAGGRVIRTPVGEANVAAAMLENNCIIGGEGNGGVIDLRVGPIRDSLVAIALVLQLMAETGKSVGRLANSIGGYYMSKEKFSAEPAQAEQIIALAKSTFSEARLNDADGCRFDFEDGWLHLRVSNTEPVMRIIVEAKHQSAAQKYLDAAAEIRGKVLG